MEGLSPVIPPAQQQVESRKEIRNLIEKIKGQLTKKESNYYRDNLSDKAIFASLLLDFDDSNDNAYIEELINDLYDYDWSSYWHSTQSKNNAFMAFQKYLSKTGANNVADFTFSVGTEPHPNPLQIGEGTKIVSLRDKLG
jgi:hypothetical protein